MNEKEQHKTSIGGQAIIEGVMMRGPHKTAMAVRKPDGEIVVECNENGTKKKKKILRIPIIRGCVNFVESLVIGMKALMFSAEFMDLEDEEETESKFDQWLERKFGDKVKDIVIYVSIVLSIFLSIGMFILLPTAVTRGIEFLFSLTPAAAIAETKAFTSITEGILRMLIFIGYLAAVSQMKDIRRVFEYHGAEHKTIACYESGEELTVENVKKYPRFHPRCGTSFLLFVMIISIILFALLPKTGIILRMLMRLALLPVVAGLSYEVIKWAGRSKAACVTWLSKPGLWLQKLTTREPDESQIEVAIASMQAVIPEDREEAKW
ncbi:MAG: DUF1385 domain-containing protein [Ruminococcaceae bacterium]|nr:DUF1385 domain-containing protein [Oscillospiraceae bacterium]